MPAAYAIHYGDIITLPIKSINFMNKNWSIIKIVNPHKWYNPMSWFKPAYVKIQYIGPASDKVIKEKQENIFKTLEI